MIEDNQFSFDKDQQYNQLIENHIGFGNAQHKMARALKILSFSEGSESIILGFLIPMLTKEWNLSTLEQSLLLAGVTIGVPVGTALQGLSDRYGRYTFILVDALMLTIFGLFSCICWNMLSFFIARFFYLVAMGISMPLTSTYTAEISPIEYRGQMISNAWIFWCSGYLTTCVLAWLLLVNNQWRLILLIICIPGIFALIESLLYGRESLHYLWATRRTDEVYELTNYMCQLNERPILSREYVLRLMESEGEPGEQKEIPFKQLFTARYLGSTIRLIFIWVSVNFIYYGLSLLLPTILKRVFSKAQADPNLKYVFMIVVSLLELGSYWVTPSVMGHPDIGRKKAIYSCLAMTFSMTILILLVGEGNLPAWLLLLALLKISNTIALTTAYTYTNEVYQTMLRSKALGTCSLLGRASTSVLGMVGVAALEWFNGNGLYFIYLIVSAVGFGCAFTMPYCTLRKQKS